MIRLTALELENFKNVEFGKVTLSKWDPETALPTSDIVGIYGQNGSGKTAVIQALGVLQTVFIDESIDDVARDFVAKGHATAKITLKGGIFDGDSETCKYLFVYTLTIAEREGTPFVQGESLAYKPISEEKSVLRTVFDYACNPEESLGFTLTPKVAWDNIAAIDDMARTNLIVAQRITKGDSRSLLFSEEFDELCDDIDNRKPFDEGAFSKKTSKALQEVFLPLLAIVREIRLFGYADFAVLSTSRHAESIVNHLHIATHEGEYGFLADVNFALDLTKPNVIEEEYYEPLLKTVKNINPVLSALVPGLSIGVKALEKVMRDNGDVGVRVEITCTRGDVTVPLRCESEGIKKLVSILTLLIDVYAKPGACIAIDELDSGIFEFLLGELLQVLQDHGRGQLIFTAHNLRPLEVVGKNSLIFTTTNPQNRYVSFKGSQQNNNLRSQYLRAINLGGQPETVYESTSKFDIDSAFYDAGFPVEEETK